jgi:hypothetical protein
VLTPRRLASLALAVALGAQGCQAPVPKPAPTPPGPRGTTWGEVINVTNDPVESLMQEANGFQVGVDASGRVHVAFRDAHLDPRFAEIYYTHTDAAGAWSAPTKISELGSLISLGANQQARVNGPVLAVSPAGTIHVTWGVFVADSAGEAVAPRQTFYQRSTDGLTFSAPVLVATGGDDFGGATLCQGGRFVNIISTDTTRKALHVSHSDDEGLTFTSFPIATYVSAKEAPVCAIAGDLAWVVWQDDRDGVVVGGLKRRDVHVSRSLNGGITWEPEVNLSRTPESGSSDQSIAVSANGRVHVVFHDDADDGNRSWEMYYVGSRDNGVTWDAPQKLTTTPAVLGDGVNIDLPSVAATDDGTVYAVWQDNRSGVFQTFFKWGTDGDWAPEYAISGQTRANYGPSIARSPDGSSIHTVWTGLGASRDVFYRQLR